MGCGVGGYLLPTAHKLRIILPSRCVPMKKLLTYFLRGLVRTWLEI